MLSASDLGPLLAAIARAEAISRDVALRQSRLAPAPLARALAQQARQEAAHATLFGAAAAALPGGARCPPRVERALQAFRVRLERDLDRAELAGTLVGLQGVLESLACVALEPPPGELARLADRLVPLRLLVLRQEDAHHQLGERWIGRLVSDPAQALAPARLAYTALAADLLDAGLAELACLAGDAPHYRTAIATRLALSPDPQVP
ncbi:hypothetical protein WG922_14065 [Ramlibacter sp. AN1015]|uniref:hypothetical protein n=1 Tax=Ramlibacter sp. AN1015 TaxID=3133428 RepID=UPI0030BE50F8